MKTWIPRLLRDDGMIPMCESPSYAKACTQYVALKDHEQALAEKDREIVKWRRIRTPTHGNCCTCQQCGLDHDSCRCDLDDVCDELDQLKKAYQQLMERAVGLAETVLQGHRHRLKTLRIVRASASIVLAEKLMASPEVQAWKELNK